MRLPPGLTARPLTMADAPAVTELVVAAELSLLGETITEQADIVGAWQRPSFDLTRSTIGVFAGQRLIGWAEHSGGDRAGADVHPQWLGQGIGTALTDWLCQTARAAGVAVLGMPVPAGSPGEALLLELGFRPRWQSWVLQLPPGAEIPGVALPVGFSVRAALPQEHRQAWQVVEDAFLEWSDRPRQPFPDWAATTVARPGFEPWQLRAATAPDGSLAGACLVQVFDGCGFVDKVAVRRADRGRGLGQALLADAFAAARAHGATRSELSTDTRTGALGLYRRLGMVVTSEWVNLATDLGVDLGIDRPRD
jgi:GNAT superfamily N-acetyltransferase